MFRIAKTGSRFRKAILQNISDQLDISDDQMERPTLRRPTREELLNINNLPHLKFMFTRDPFERWISAWNNKLMTPISEKPILKIWKVS